MICSSPLPSSHPPSSQVKRVPRYVGNTVAEWENVDFYPNRWTAPYSTWATTPSTSSTTQARMSSSVWRAWVEVRTSDYKLRLDEAQAEIGDAIRTLCQACPSCHILIAKAVACDHIRCPCGADFCYSCGGNLAVHDIGGGEEQARGGGRTAARVQLLGTARRRDVRRHGDRPQE